MLYVSYIRCFANECMSYGCEIKASTGHMICNTVEDNADIPYFNMYCTCERHKEICQREGCYFVTIRFMLKLLKKHKEKQLNNFGSSLLSLSNDRLLKEYILQ